jgi:CrcB protein
MNAAAWVGVAVFGAVGALARFFLDAVLSARVGRELPIGTLCVNLSGAFILGLLVGAALDPVAYRLAGTATIGSYTTFSTWMLETQRLVEEGAARDAALNIVLSLAAGIAAVALGRTLG